MQFLKSIRLKDAWILGILLFFMTVHRPFVALGLFSLKPFIIVMGLVICGLFFTMLLHGKIGVELPTALVAPTMT